MIVQLLSQMPYGDADSIVSFFGDHAIEHQNYSDTIFAKFTAQVAGFDVADQLAMREWIAAMSGEEGAVMGAALQAWLESHNELHKAELAAMKASGSVDLSEVDFRDPGQFETWMKAHAQIHQFEDRTLRL